MRVPRAITIRTEGPAESMFRTSRRRFIVAATAPAVLALTLGGFPLAHGARANSTIAISTTANSAIAINVNAADVLGTVPGIADGLNTRGLRRSPQRQREHDGDRPCGHRRAALSRRLHRRRLPLADENDGQRSGLRESEQRVRRLHGHRTEIGASPIITVNYGSGTAAEAAAWVKYADVTKKYGVKYWELGNEIFGDGTYGAQWEYNTKPKGARAYADNIADYITQMKAADPGIKVGAVLTTYNGWPDGLVASKYGDTADWNTTVLKKDGPKLDFVILHYYPTSKSESGLLAQYRNIATIVKHTRAEIKQYAGSNAANIQIMITETDSSFEFDSGPSALFAVDTYLTFLRTASTTSTGGTCTTAPARPAPDWPTAPRTTATKASSPAAAAPAAAPPAARGEHAVSRVLRPAGGFPIRPGGRQDDRRHELERDGYRLRGQDTERHEPHAGEPQPAQQRTCQHRLRRVQARKRHLRTAVQRRAPEAQSAQPGERAHPDPPRLLHHGPEALRVGLCS